MLVIGNYLRLLLIFIPLIIGIIYLFPFVNSQMERVDPLLQLFGGTPNSGSVVDTILDRLSPQDAQKIIQSSGESNQ
jgi:hypothetical protein